MLLPIHDAVVSRGSHWSTASRGIEQVLPSRDYQVYCTACNKCLYRHANVWTCSILGRGHEEERHGGASVVRCGYGACPSWALTTCRRIVVLRRSVSKSGAFGLAVDVRIRPQLKHASWRSRTPTCRYLVPLDCCACVWASAEQTAALVTDAGRGAIPDNCLNCGCLYLPFHNMTAKESRNESSTTIYERSTRYDVTLA